MHKSLLQIAHFIWRFQIKRYSIDVIIETALPERDRFEERFSDIFEASEHISERRKQYVGCKVFVRAFIDMPLTEI